MSEINFEDTIINITLGDIVQQFTEEDLQRQMPVLMQDIDAETKELVDTYQSYISSGNFAEAATYRANNPALETRIWDAFKANSLLAYCAFAYLYAKNQHQQCYFSEIEPGLFDENTGIGAVNGDVWFKYTTKNEDGAVSIDYSIPFNTYVLKNGMWEKFTVTPELNVASDSDIDEICNSSITELTNPDYLINETGLKKFKNKVDSDADIRLEDLTSKVGDLSQLSTSAKTSTVDAINECFQYASDGKQAIIDAITGLGVEGLTTDYTFSEIAQVIASATAKIGDTIVVTKDHICDVSGTFRNSGSYTESVDFGVEFVETPTIKYSVTGSGHFGEHDGGGNSVKISDLTTKSCTVKFSWGSNTGNNYTYSKWVKLIITGRQLMV